MTPSTHRHPRNFRWRERFPNVARVMAGEGGAVYAAEDLEDGSLWIIKDEGTLADLLPEDEHDDLVALTRYSKRERARWVADVTAIRQRRSAPDPNDPKDKKWPSSLDPFLAEILDDSASRLQRLAADRHVRSVNERDHLQPCCAEAARRLAGGPAGVTAQRKVEFSEWPRLGSVDVAITSMGSLPLLFELKAGAGTDALGQCVWDAAKLAFATQRELGLGYLIGAAPAADWERHIRGVEFFADAHHEAALLRVLYADWWRHWEKHGDPQPAELPRQWWTEHVHTAQFAVAETPWELRLSQIFPGHDRVPWPPLTTG